VDRILIKDNYGRTKVEQVASQKRVGFIRILYGNRALEWLNLRKVFKELLVFFQFALLCTSVDNITIAWSYDDNLSTVFYKPSLVFKAFSFIDFLDEDQYCLCTSANRLKNYCDPLTTSELSSYCKASMHVRTMDLSIIQHSGLRLALSQGLNHIPLKPSNIAEAIAITMDAFMQVLISLFKKLGCVYIPSVCPLSKLQIVATSLDIGSLVGSF
jgi:hypothetical protein